MQQLPEFHDPCFSMADVKLIELLGGCVPYPASGGATNLQLDNSRWAAKLDDPAGASRFLYMPCCPRRLYGTVVTANRATGTLRKIAVLGNSFKALSVSWWRERLCFHHFRPCALPSSNEQETSLLLNACPPTAAADGRAAEEEENEAEVAATAILTEMLRARAVVEQPCPDFGAHGVAIALHTFL